MHRHTPTERPSWETRAGGMAAGALVGFFAAAAATATWILAAGAGTILRDLVELAGGVPALFAIAGALGAVYGYRNPPDMTTKGTPK